MHFHGWQSGLKTGMYYLRTKAATDAIKFTVEVDQVRKASATGDNDAAQRAIEQIKAATPEAGCLNCSA